MQPAKDVTAREAEASLPADISGLSRAALRDNLEKRGLPTHGTKTEMQDRLVDWVSHRFEYEMGIRGAKETAEARDNSLEESGSTYAVGVNHRGQLGFGDTTPREVFTCIPNLKGRVVDMVSAGPDYALAVTEDHYVYAWGAGFWESVGACPGGIQRRPAGAAEDLGTAAPDSMPRARAAGYAPVVIGALRGEGIVEVAAGASHCAAVSDVGDLFTWGTARSGQLGLGEFRHAGEPQLVMALQRQRVAAVAVGAAHSFAVTYEGLA